MVQFLSIFFFSWISSIFVGFFKSSRFFVSLCMTLSCVHYGPAPVQFHCLLYHNWWRSLTDGCTSEQRFIVNLYPQTFMILSRWPRGQRRCSAAARLLGLWVRIPPVAWMSVRCVLSCKVKVFATGRSLVQRSPTECVCVCVCPWVWSGATTSRYI